MISSSLNSPSGWTLQNVHGEREPETWTECSTAAYTHSRQQLTSDGNHLDSPRTRTKARRSLYTESQDCAASARICGCLGLCESRPARCMRRPCTMMSRPSRPHEPPAATDVTGAISSGARRLKRSTAVVCTVCRYRMYSWVQYLCLTCKIGCVWL